MYTIVNFDGYVLNTIGRQRRKRSMTLLQRIAEIEFVIIREKDKKISFFFFIFFSLVVDIDKKKKYS